LTGIGIQYPESVIVNAKHQSSANTVIVGQRMPPQIIIRAADARPIELHDLLHADARFKVLIFAGDTTDAVQSVKVEKLAEDMSRPESFLNKYTPAKEWNKMFDIFVISSGKKENIDYTKLPELFRSHWSKCVSPRLWHPLVNGLAGFLLTIWI
jgi:phenol 2-monooxygenase (NADPH)